MNWLSAVSVAWHWALGTGRRGQHSAEKPVIWREDKMPVGSGTPTQQCRFVPSKVPQKPRKVTGFWPSPMSPWTLRVLTRVPLLACVPAQSCLTLCDPMECSPPGSSVHGILQATPADLLESGIEPTCLASPALAGRFFPTVPAGRPHCLLPSHLFTPRFL